jgi:hypothetical protein
MAILTLLTQLFAIIFYAILLSSSANSEPVDFFPLGARSRLFCQANAGVRIHWKEDVPGNRVKASSSDGGEAFCREGAWFASHVRTSSAPNVDYAQSKVLGK